MHAFAAATASTEAELHLLAHPSELVTVRRFAEEAAASFGLGQEDRYALAFAVNEAVSNAIEHGRPSSEGTIHLYVAEEEGALAFYVEDYGMFAPKVVPLEDFPARGRGFTLMGAVVDEVDVRRGRAGTVVRLCKRPRGP